MIREPMFMHQLRWLDEPLEFFDGKWFANNFFLAVDDLEKRMVYEGLLHMGARSRNEKYRTRIRVKAKSKEI